MRKTALLAATFVCACAAPALAASCGSEIELFEQQYDLTAALPQSEPPAGAAEPPATVESRGVSPSDKLAPSGGVLAPPEGGRTAVIEPPSTGPTSTPSPPAVPPHTAEGPSAGSAELSAAKRAQMQAHLNAARAADARGDEKQCFERLGAARAIPEPG
jgi:hypothetical protein